MQWSSPQSSRTTNTLSTVFEGMHAFYEIVNSFQRYPHVRHLKIFSNSTMAWDCSFFQAIVRMRFAIKPRMQSVLRSDFKPETLKHSSFELQHSLL